MKDGIHSCDPAKLQYHTSTIMYPDIICHNSNNLYHMTPATDALTYDNVYIHAYLDQGAFRN